MNEKQQKFCELIAKNYTIDQACSRIGYKNTRTGKNLLKNDTIQQEIARLRKQNELEKVPTREKLLAEYGKIAFDNSMHDPKAQLKALREIRLMLNNKE